jgi:LytS/YehU family sensor histidine kinase
VLAEPERVPDFARGPITALLAQAGVRLENLRLTAERVAATRAELRALQAQVQPHFLFNALNALAYLIEADPMAAQRFTGRLADMLRYTVEAGKRHAALLSDEIAFVEDYLGVARERYENPLHFRYRGDDALLSTSVPPLLLQPLVENSLKHGIKPGESSLRMTLDARQAEGWFELEFADDGVPHGNGTRGLGTGLENLEQRVRHFAGAGARVQATKAAGGGFVVRMAWPIPTGGTE